MCRAWQVLYGPKSPSVAGALAGMADVAMKTVRAGEAEGGEADPAQLLRCVNQADSAVAILQARAHSHCM